MLAGSSRHLSDDVYALHERPRSQRSVKSFRRYARDGGESLAAIASSDEVVCVGSHSRPVVALSEGSVTKASWTRMVATLLREARRERDRPQMD